MITDSRRLSRASTRHRSAGLLLLLMLVTAAAPTAAQDFASPPPKEGCDPRVCGEYANCLVDGGGGDLEISPHRVEVGETFTATISEDPPFGLESWSWNSLSLHWQNKNLCSGPGSLPSIEQVEPCPANTDSCEFRVTSAGSMAEDPDLGGRPWVIMRLRFSVGCCASWDEDYFGVVEESDDDDDDNDDPQSPTARFTATVQDDPPRTVAFDASGSSSPNGQIAAYEWSFGDGETGAGVQPTHTYAADDTYFVRLRVTDEEDEWARVTKQVEVNAARMRYRLAVDPDTAALGQEMHLHAVVENTGEVPLEQVHPVGEVLAESDDGAQVERRSGPAPSMLALEPGAVDTMTWVYEATAAGTVRFTLLAVEGVDPEGNLEEEQGTCALGKAASDKESEACTEAGVEANELVVNATGDAPDEHPEDGACDTGEIVTIDGEEEPECTLRAALEAAHAEAAGKQAGPSTITFDIPGGGVQTIRPQTALPPLDILVIIDGTTQPGYQGQPLIELDGSEAGVNASGLRVNEGASGSVVKGLVVNRFGWYGLLLNGSTDVRVESCFIGTNATGTARAGNGRDGLRMSPSGGALIQTQHQIRSNVISGNDSSGVWIGTFENEVVGNRIGTTADGTTALGNGKHGVEQMVEQNTIGGGTEEERNLLSGNARAGIFLDNGFSDVVGNYIGTNAAGDAALPNGEGGIDSNGSRSRIEGNLISGNAQFGLRIASPIVKGFVAQENVIVANQIGTNAGGNDALGNEGPGIWLGVRANKNEVGGSAQGEGNLISGNQGDGILLARSPEHSDQDWPEENVITSNLIGTDATGTKRLANQGAGVHLQGARNSQIGPPSDQLLYQTPPAQPSNVISGNTGPGIWIEAGCNQTDCETTRNLIHANFVGTDLSGQKSLGNVGPGVAVEQGVEDQVIANVIAANGRHGVVISGGYARHNAVDRNHIGTDHTATKALGNLEDGVHIEGGGISTTSVFFNVVVANRGNGITLLGNGEEGAPSVRIVDNAIGTNRDRDAGLGNQRHGIFMDQAASENEVNYRICFNDCGEGIAESRYQETPNVIAYNGGSGVAIASGTDNLIGINNIFANGLLGIDLGADGITPNDAFDQDDGPNHQQNAPVLTQAIRSDGGVHIQGYLSSTQADDFDLLFYANTPERGCGGASGFCQGETLLGKARVTTPAIPETTEGFLVEFDMEVTGEVTPGQRITAIATDADGNTSEFSNVVGLAEVEQTAEAELRVGETATVRGARVTVQAGGDKTRGAGLRLYATRYETSPVGQGVSGSAAASDDGTARVPTGVGAPYWTLAPVGLDGAMTFDLCLDASGLSAEEAAQVVLVRRHPETGGLWKPHDTYLETHDGTRFACTTGLTALGDFGFGLGEAAALAAPTLTAPEDGTDAVLEHEITLTWEAVPEAAGYDLQLARSPGFASSVVDTTGLTAMSLAARVERSTRYWWRVRGVTADGAVGPWSPTWHFATSATAVATEDDTEMPERFMLEANYPNPFNPQTTIPYALPQAGPVRLTVYDMLGREVARLMDSTLPAGQHAVVFAARDLPSGVYVYRLQAGNFTQTRRMLLVK